MYIQNKLVLLVCIISIIFVNFPETGIPMDPPQENLSSILNQLKTMDVENPLLAQWDFELKSRSRFHNNETILGIEMLSHRFFYAEDVLENCCKIESDKSRRYSPVWLQEMEMRFGKDQITLDYQLIRNVLFYLSMRNSSQFCFEQEKEVLYREIYLRNAISEYTTFFFQFYETLNPKDKAKLNNYKKNIERLSAIAGELFYHKTIGSFPRVETFPLARLELNNWINTPVAQFLLNYPDLTVPFNLIQAVTDLRNKIEGKIMSGQPER